MMFQYAVKFICTSNVPGTSQTTSSFVPGSYQTCVNIHNPQPKEVRFRMKLARATSTQVDPPDITPFLIESLQPDQATKIDCGRLKEFGPPGIHGFEGFLVIESTASFDVIAVYTAAYEGGVRSMDVEDVRERVIEEEMSST